MKSDADSKIIYINSLKILLTVLVVLHHAFITYGASGSWYYTERTILKPALVIMNMFTITNMTFFMGLFFFLSSFFIEPSMQKKGFKKYLTERLKRLGIPLIFYSIVLSPTLNYIAEHYGKGEHKSFYEYMSGYRHWIDFGVLWFVAALLIFSILFAVLKTKFPTISEGRYSYPGDISILIFAVFLGFITYLVRGYFPIGWTLKPFGFQLSDFPQYILLFILGIIAFNNNWLDEINYRKSKQWFYLALIFIVVVLPLLSAIKFQTKSPDETIQGHFTWQSLLFAEWQQITGISLIVGLLGIARQRWNWPGKLRTKLARNSYGVYIFHPLILICLSLLVKGIPIEPIFKLLFIAPIAVICSFAFINLLLKIPVVNKII